MARKRTTAAATGPAMVTVRSNQPHTYQNVDRPVGSTYEIEEANLGAVSPRLASRVGADAPRARATPAEDGEDTPAPRRKDAAAHTAGGRRPRKALRSGKPKARRR
jgi:hypothetical protein